MAQLNGQQQIDVNAATVKPVQTVQPAKPTAPKKEELHYEHGKTLTEDQLKKMTNSEKERYFQERDLALDEACRQKQEKRKRRAQQIRELESREREEVKEVKEVQASEEEEEEEPKEKKSRGQRRLCKKHKVKRRELKRGIETARAIFVPKLATNKEIPTKVLIAILDLLENGDISSV